jgi:hypothetical protein
MISVEQITSVFDQATRDFRGSAEYCRLVSGEAAAPAAREFIGNVFRTHYLSSHIVALCFAALPSGAAELLKENLLGRWAARNMSHPIPTCCCKWHAASASAKA